jgi:hypothetical protein
MRSIARARSREREREAGGKDHLEDDEIDEARVGRFGSDKERWGESSVGCKMVRRGRVVVGWSRGGVVGSKKKERSERKERNGAERRRLEMEMGFWSVRRPSSRATMMMMMRGSIFPMS